MKQLTFVFNYSRKAYKFLETNDTIISRDNVEESLIFAIKKLKKLEDNNCDVKPLKGKLRGFFRVRRGDIRIIFRFEGQAVIVTDVFDIGQRGGIYN